MSRQRELEGRIGASLNEGRDEAEEEDSTLFSDLTYPWSRHHWYWQN